MLVCVKTMMAMKELGGREGDSILVDIIGQIHHHTKEFIFALKF
jgi:hypothetical protein